MIFWTVHKWRQHEDKVLFSCLLLLLYFLLFSYSFCIFFFLASYSLLFFLFLLLSFLFLFILLHFIIPLLLPFFLLLYLHLLPFLIFILLFFPFLFSVLSRAGVCSEWNIIELREFLQYWQYFPFETRSKVSSCKLVWY